MGLFRLARNAIRDRRGEPIVGRHRRRRYPLRGVARRARIAAEPRHRQLLDALNAETR